MRLFQAILTATLFNLSFQISWEQLANLSEEEAKAFLDTGFFHPSKGSSQRDAVPQVGDTGRWNPATAAVPQSAYEIPHLHPGVTLPYIQAQPELIPVGQVHQEGVHDLPSPESEDSTIASSGLSADQNHVATEQPAASALGRERPRAPAVRRKRPPRQRKFISAEEATIPSKIVLPAIVTDHLEAPQPLTLSQRNDVLREAAKQLNLKPMSTSTLWHPFAAEELPQNLINEFALSTALMREYKPGLLVQSRSRTAPIWQQEGGMTMQRALDRHLFVYRYAQIKTLQRPQTVFQFIGMLEVTPRSYEAVNYLKAYTTTHVLIRRIGPDSFVDESAMKLRGSL